MSLPPDGTNTRVITLPYSLALLAFGGSRVILEALLHPFDTVKTRIQSSNGFWKSGGFKSPYRGLLPASIGCVPTILISQYLHQSAFDPNSNPPENLLAFGMGVSSRTLASLVFHIPFEVVKQRRQTEATPSRELIRTAFRNEGIFGIYRGFWSTAALDCAVIGLSIPIWETFKFIYSGSLGRPLNSSETFTCGIAGGALAAFLTTPLDVGKTRIMLHKISEDTVSSADRVPSLISTLRSIRREEGLKGLFAGGVIRTSMAPVGSTIFSMLYVTSLLQLGVIYANMTDESEPYDDDDD